MTRPLPFTNATPVAVEVQVTAGFAITFPSESFTVTVSCVCAPGVSVSAFGVIATEPTGIGLTVTVAAPTLPPLVATSATVPTALLLEDQVTVRPLSVLPAESFTVAVSCTVPPIVIESGVGASVIDAIGTRATLIAAVPVLDPLLPVIVACPDPAAVTVAVSGPVAVTVATPVAPLENVTVAPGIGCPELSVTSAVSVCV
jgi:hypothetical protein